MFCTSLRRRPSCSDLLPVITAGSYKERDIETHDLQVDYKSKQHQNRQLRVIVITGSNLGEHAGPATVIRLEHFALLTGAVDVAIIFHMNASLHGLLELQRLLLTNSRLPSLPILPLKAARELPTVLEAFLAPHISAAPETIAHTSSTTLLSLCCTGPPLSREDIFLLTDIFTDLRDLASTCTSDSYEGRDKLERMDSLVGRERASSIMDFWREEWVE